MRSVSTEKMKPKGEKKSVYQNLALAHGTSCLADALHGMSHTVRVHDWEDVKVELVDNVDDLRVTFQIPGDELQGEVLHCTEKS